MTSPIRKIIEAGGGPVKVAKALNVTYTALNGWERAGYFPLARAKQAIELYPGVAELRDLVRHDLREAMDMQGGGDLLK